MSDELPLIDTNIVLRHVTQDSEALSPRATAFTQELAGGEASGRLLDQAIFEAAHTLLGMYRATRDEVKEALLGFIELRGVVVLDISVWRIAFDLFLATKLSLVDAYHVAYMQVHGITEIISFDTDFDAIPGITRVEP